MKILFATPYFYPQIGGLENYAYNIAKRLAKDHTVIVVTSNPRKKGLVKESFENMQIYRLPSLFTISNTPINPFWYFSLKRIIQEENPNVINAHMPVPFIADLITRIAPEKTIITYHNDIVKEKRTLKLLIKMYYLLLGDKTLRLCKRIIATSKYYTENSPYLKKYSNKISIVSPGVDLKSFCPALKKGYLGERNTKKIVFVGQLSKTHAHKGLEYLVQALALVIKEDANVELFVVGKGNNSEYYKTLAKTLGVKEKVNFLGFVENQNLPLVYKDATCVILPTHNNAEGWGMVLAEANACGIPVIGTTVGGIPAVVQDGYNGLLVPPRDENKLAEAILRIITNEKLAKELGKNGAKKAKGEWDWDILAEKTKGIYHGI